MGKDENDRLISKFKKQLNDSIKGKVTMTVPNSSLVAGKYCATVDFLKK